MTRAGCTWLTPPRPKMGGCGACRVRTAARVVPLCTRRRGGRDGALASLVLALGHSHTASPPLGGHEHAKVRAGGRRRRRRQTPRGNDGDRVQVRQAWWTETASDTRTWGMFTRGSLLSDKRPQGCGRVPVKQSGCKPSRWTAACVERRPRRLEGGKDCKVLPILTITVRGSLRALIFLSPACEEVNRWR